jgi:hypothetical protein
MLLVLPKCFRAKNRTESQSAFSSTSKSVDLMPWTQICSMIQSSWFWFNIEFGIENYEINRPDILQFSRKPGSFFSHTNLLIVVGPNWLSILFLIKYVRLIWRTSFDAKSDTASNGLAENCWTYFWYKKFAMDSWYLFWNLTAVGRDPWQ